MKNIKKYFEKNITPNKILKLNKDDFMKVFLQETVYEEDLEFLKTEFPEDLADYRIDDHWFDKHGIYRQVKDNHFVICNKTTNGLIVSGEIKFKENGEPLFARYSENGSFYRLDNLILNENKLYRGTIPDSEVNIKRNYPQEPSFLIESIETNPVTLNLDYSEYKSFKTKKGNGVLKLKINNEKKELQININLDNFSEIDTYLFINEKLINSIFSCNLHSTLKTLDEEIYKEYTSQIEKIGEIFTTLQERKFEKELESYLKILNEVRTIFDNINVKDIK